MLHPRLVTINDAARAVGRSTETVRRAISRHNLPLERVHARCVLVNLDDVQRLYASMPERV